MPRPAAILNNTPIGTPPSIAYPAIDARTSALEVLAEYISELTFYKPGTKGQPPIPFSIPIANIHIEQPDNETDLIYPGIVFESAGEAQIDDLGFYDETSQDVFGPHTVLWCHAEHIEMINIRIATQYRSDRRAILAGLERALSPVEEIYGMSLVCSNYYTQTASVCPISRALVDGAQAANNRREATLKVDLRINIVQLVNYRNLVMYARVVPIPQ